MNTGKSKIRLLLVDDHQIVMDGIRNLLRKSDDIWIVGEFVDGHDALEFLEENEVDLLITDLQMPGISGLELCQKVKAAYPTLKVLVLSMHYDPETVQQIFAVAAEGYLLKNTSRRELKDAIYRVIEGGTYYSREVLHSVMGEAIRPQEAENPAIDLTPREKEILQLIAEEHTTTEIAEKLFISPRTVETHRENLLHKTEAKSVVGLIRYGLKHRLIRM